MKNAIIAAVVIAIAIVGVLALQAGSKDTSGTAKSETNSTTMPPPTTTSGSGEKGGANQSAMTVTIEGYAYSPRTLTIKKGDTVTWTNKDTARHDVALDDGAPAGGPKGPLMGRGESYSFTFNTVGTFNYHCSPHPYMHGTVTVTE